MGAIISLAIFIILCIIFCVFCGYITKAINESKGYSGGFWLGLLLQPIGILIVAYKKEQPNAKANAFRAVPVQKVLKKFRYPFAPPQFEPIAMLKGEIDAEAKAAGLNLTFMLIHGVFMLGWYSVILGAYLWYIMGYAVYWLFKSQSLKKIVDDAKPDAAEKVAFAKEKTRAAFEGLKDKAAALAAEHKKSSDEKIPVADECNREENYNTSSDETVYQSDEEYSYETADPITDDGTSYECESDENNSPALEQSSIIYKKESQVWDSTADDTNIQPAPMSSSPVYNTGTYSYNENKKSPIIYILIGVISVLLVVLGVLFGMLVMKNKSENNNSRTDVMYGDSTADTSKIEEMITTAIESTEETIPTTTTLVETTNSIPDQYTSDEISAMFSDYIAENPDPNRTYDNSDYGYALVELNNDGTQELLITEGEKEKGSPWIIGVYTIKKGKLTLLMGFDSRFPGSLYEDNIISYYSSLGQGGGTAFYKYTSGDSLDMVDIISYDYSTGTKVMYHNRNVITEAESYSILAKYKPLQFEPKPLKINIHKKIGFTFLDSIDIVKSELNAYQLLDETDETSISGEQQHLIYYQYPSLENISAILGVCFVENRLVGVNFRFESSTYSSAEIFENIKNNIIAQYGQPDSDDGDTIYWYADPFGSDTYFWLYNYDIGTQLSYFASYDITDNDKLLPIDVSKLPLTIRKPQNNFTTYDTSAAGSDFSFNNDAYQRKVTTENDSLNLRAAPSASAEIIIQMPKNSDILLWGVNAEWAYVSYTENGITYYGYANREFIGVP